MVKICLKISIYLRIFLSALLITLFAQLSGQVVCRIHRRTKYRLLASYAFDISLMNRSPPFELSFYIQTRLLGLDIFGLIGTLLILLLDYFFTSTMFSHRFFCKERNCQKLSDLPIGMS